MAEDQATNEKQAVVYVKGDVSRFMVGDNRGAPVSMDALPTLLREGWTVVSVTLTADKCEGYFVLTRPETK